MTSLQEHVEHTLTSFKSSVEGLALEELSRLEVERDQLEDALHKTKASIRQVKSVLQAARPQQNKTKPTPRQRDRTGRVARIGAEAREEVVAWLASQNGNEITAARLREAFPQRSDSWANIALKQLRDEGVVRLAGKSGSTFIYRTL